MRWSPRATKSSAIWASSSPSNPSRMLKLKPPRSRSIIAHGCCRVDLAGGTLDLWPLYLFHPGAVTVNMGVSVMTHCRITPTKAAAIMLRSLDTKKEDHFANVSELLRAERFNHPLAGYLC